MAKPRHNILDLDDQYFANNHSCVNNVIERITQANALIRRGARSSIVHAVTGLSKKDILQLYHDLTGMPPSAGLLPRDLDWPTKSIGNNMHTALFLEIYSDICRKCHDPARKGEIYLVAYCLYEMVAQETPALNINRAWRIIHQFSIGHIELIKCRSCRISYVTNTTLPKHFRVCPHCDSALLKPPAPPKPKIRPLWFKLRVAGLEKRHMKSTT